mgnify:CR=1 FL=1
MRASRRRDHPLRSRSAASRRGVGVERTFKIHSPRIEKIEVVRHGVGPARPAVLPARPRRQGRDPPRAPHERLTGVAASTAPAGRRPRRPAVADVRGYADAPMTVIVPTLRHERRLWNEGLVRGRRRRRGRRRADLRRGRRGGRDHASPAATGSRASATRRRSRRPSASASRRSSARGPWRSASGAASVREIDQLNIYHATHLAMRRAIARARRPRARARRRQPDRRASRRTSGRTRTIVDGDAKVYSIACASVVAKVVRDRMMALLAARYPGYGWEHNQGYATRDHRDAIRALGLTPFHRRSFLALQRTLAGDQLDLDLLGDPSASPETPRPARARAGPGHGRRRGARRRRSRRCSSSASPVERRRRSARRRPGQPA